MEARNVLIVVVYLFSQNIVYVRKNVACNFRNFTKSDYVSHCSGSGVYTW